MMSRFVCTAALLILALTAARAQVPADVELVELPSVSGLSAPLGLTHAGDGSGRVFIVEQGGRVRVVDAAGNLIATPFVDLGNRTALSGERGLLDIAFHPDYASNGRFYLHYTAGITRPSGTSFGDTVVAEFNDNGDPGTPVSDPDRIILTVAQDFGNHNGGQMKFGPDGYLYLALGDGGSAGDPCERAQTVDPADIQTGGSCRGSDSVALLGSILRLDVDATTPAGGNNLCAAAGDGSANYAIPADNPFARDPENPAETRCAEILHYGLRNPWRFGFDRVTGDLWIGDVGQNQWEEIDLLDAATAGGRNLGWDCYEASSSFEPGGCPPDGELVFPVLEYDHASTGGCSVTGGYRYRGPVDSLQGIYIFGDFCSGHIWFASRDGGAWTRQTFATGYGGLRSFGEDEAGNVYAVASGRVYRFDGIDEVLLASGFEPVTR
jgi:glucose/arabinose dehydrogenase